MRSLPGDRSATMGVGPVGTSFKLSWYFAIHATSQPNMSHTPPAPVVWHNPSAPVKNAKHPPRNRPPAQPNYAASLLASLDAADSAQRRTSGACKAFRNALVRARTGRKWTQKDLARQANVGLQDLTNLERGNAVHGAEGLRLKLNRALQMDLPGVASK